LQAEDGIGDWSVTGVQTCSLPIYERRTATGGGRCLGRHRRRQYPRREGRGISRPDVAKRVLVKDGWRVGALAGACSALRPQKCGGGSRSSQRADKLTAVPAGAGALARR